MYVLRFSPPYFLFLSLLSCPSDGSCTWRVVEREKTVDLNCLVLQHSFTDVCRQDGSTPPYPRAEGVLAAVFESDDPTKGGCPALDPPVDANANNPPPVTLADNGKGNLKSMPMPRWDRRYFM
jgi:hypothetical protein